MKSTVFVFSPHQDDETLGCGGTIIKRKRAGAQVKIVYMTDGRKSHSHLISEEKLKLIRSNEALKACQKLGLEENDVVFLEYRDGELAENQNSAFRKVGRILKFHKPTEIFIPHRKEPTKDHSATNRIVMSALQEHKRKPTVYEYPVWLWYRPTLNFSSISEAKETLFWLKSSITSRKILLRDCRYSVYIGDVLQLKHAALDQYRSQMTRLIPDPRWTTLGDISNGEFLKCFFQQYEIFHRFTS